MKLYLYVINTMRDHVTFLEVLLYIKKRKGICDSLPDGGLWRRIPLFGRNPVMRGPFCSNVSDYYLVLERESIMEEKIIPATPYVTVIMPAYNAGQYIARSIQSVIDQTFPNWVLYAIDDGSHDDTCRIIQEFSAGDDRIIFLKN